jgi:acetyltransferase
MSETPQDLLIRPIGPDDSQRLTDAFARLSERSRYRRFLAAKPSLSSAELRYLTDIDQSRHAALAAIDPETGDLIGEARYAMLPGCASTAEIALFVIDEWQGRGLGTLLARRIVDLASENGIAQLQATTLFENASVRALLRRLGFRARGRAGSQVELTLDLEQAVPLAA